jgi:type I restriction enzyme, S subunit
LRRKGQRMSRIDDLIAKHCPNGVEFKVIGEIAELVRGNGMPKADFVETGVGCIHYGQIYTYYGAWTNKTESFVAPEKAAKLAKVNPNDLIITNTSENIEDVCKAVAWLGDTQIVTGGHATVIKHKENPKYIAYYLQTPDFFAEKKRHATGTKVIDVSAKSLAKIKIPVPPLEIQKEIVDILDAFTKLEAELEAELEARKKQYNYYRDELLNFAGKNISWKKLGDVCNFISSGKNKNKATEGTYPVYGSTGIIARTDNYSYDKKQILVARVGANAGYVHLADGKYDVSDNTIIVNVKSDYSLKFLFYILTVMKLRQYAKGGGQPLITAGQIKEFKVPAPSIQEQERIVAILDKFDALVNDISSGLPAEISARRQQYEHYRNQLLTFQEAA